MNGPLTEPWGKLSGVPGDIDLAWHPLRDHCVDVAACAEALLERGVLARRLARLAGLPALTPILRQRLVVLAFLHDLGKVNRHFQNKAYPGRPTGGHVQEMVSLVLSDPPLDWLVDALTPLFEWARDDDDLAAIAGAWLAAVCHHGRPIGPDARRDMAGWQAAPGYDPRGEAKRLVAHAKTLFPGAWQPTTERFPTASAFQHAFSGLVMLADWLGSDRAVFPYREDPSEDRLAFSRLRARAHLETMGIDPRRARAALPGDITFESAFGFAPRHAQSVMAALAVPQPEDGPTTTLLEAETGAGKTEAAIHHYLRLFRAGAVDGMYFALPTRSAATHIESRLTAVTAKLFPDEAERPPVVLAVPGYLRVDGREGRRLPGFEVLWNDDQAERFRARAWAAENAKRFLAGAIVVGTIDQVLLSTLQVSHAHLRSTALMRHLLVVDEVHASDAYMNRLLTRVLARHREAGGHTLLMSATLGATVAAELFGTPAARGAPPALDLPYPLVTQQRGSAPATRSVVTGADCPKRVRRELLPWLDDDGSELEPLAARALDAARRGARVLILRNTVKTALATIRALERIAPAELLFRCNGRVTLHHSRFAQADRRALDLEVEAALGKRAPSQGRVVVATQTVQQSLDLNADLMFTDLCPMDVLLQRLGRLHRHDTVRPAGFEVAQVGIMVPAERDLTRRLVGTTSPLHGLGNIYEDLRVIEATWRELERHETLVIPEMNRRLVEAATNPSRLEAITRELPGLASHEAHVMGGTLAERRTADLNGVDWTRPFGEAQFVTGDQHITSRLGEEDLRVLIEGAPVGPFGAAIDELKVPHFLALRFRRTPGEELRVTPTPFAGGFAFDLGDTTYHYDRLGLRRADLEHEEDDHVGA